MKNKSLPSILLLALLVFAGFAYHAPERRDTSAKIIPAAERLDQYLPLIKGKSVAIFANNTSIVGNTHLVDTLKKIGVHIIKIFAPEHGFRGTADAGDKIESGVDPQTGVQVVSLYGKKTKPSDDDLKDVDVMIFDIQDVGVRFYTYISSLQEYIEAAIKNHKKLIILDRPNPNGFYVDGPVLEPKFRSFVGMQPVPVVYGMTIGEYARMLVGEQWIGDAKNNAADITVIPVANYDHQSKYVLPIKPSPNLPAIQSIYVYPSTCFFEGTVLSEGRGTEKPFQMFGHPSLPHNLFSFTPKSTAGAANPKQKDKVCYGWELDGAPEEILKTIDCKVQVSYLIEAYRLFPNKDSFFLVNNYFNKLAGNDVLMQQIKSGKSEKEIRDSWKPALDNFKKIRKKYLLYKDF